MTGRKYDQLLIGSVKLVLFLGACVIIACFIVSELVGLFQ